MVASQTRIRLFTRRRPASTRGGDGVADAGQRLDAVEGHALRAAEGARAVESDSIFASGLDRPFGITFYPPGPDPEWVYIAETNAVVRFPYANGDLSARGEAQTLVPSVTDGWLCRGRGSPGLSALRRRWGVKACPTGIAIPIREQYRDGTNTACRADNEKLPNSNSRLAPPCGGEVPGSADSHENIQQQARRLTSAQMIYQKSWLS
jgi:hypothetical protein